MWSVVRNLWNVSFQFLCRIKTERKAYIPWPASIPPPAPPRAARSTQREAEPQGPGLLQGRHARLPEREEEDRRHPESLSTVTRETLICTVL